MVSEIRVLVVDDSVFMRKLLSDIINSHPHLKTVGVARNGIEAIEKVEELSPDVVTMDLAMPGMTGAETIEAIEKIAPIPIVVVSSLTEQEGCSNSFEGRVQFCAKPNKGSLRSFEKISTSLYDKILLAAQSRTKSCDNNSMPIVESSFLSNKYIVAIGTSTGGPRALEGVLSELPRNFLFPILVVQHMPPRFTASLASRLDERCNIAVKEAEDNEIICSATAYIAPGDYHLGCREDGEKIRIKLDTSKPVSGHRPSVDFMFSSLSTIKSRSIIAVVLTGMGSDGTNGCIELKESGAVILAQDPETALIGGMPSSAIRAGIVDEVLPLSHMPARIIELCMRGL